MEREWWVWVSEPEDVKQVKWLKYDENFRFVKMKISQCFANGNNRYLIWYLADSKYIQVYEYV